MPAAALEEKLERLPTAPGVYLMKDSPGEVIYVGKAVNLRSRVRSYFDASSDTRAFIPFLGSVLGDVETVVVSNEKEALLLENELIKQHQPRFNVKLRDDKNFICLRLDRAERRTRAWRWCGASGKRRRAATSALTRARAASGRRCGSSTATSSCGPAPTTCSQNRAAALPAVPDRPLPGARASTRSRARSTASSVAGGGAVPRGQGATS